MTESQIQAKILKYLRKSFPKAVVWKLTEQTLCGVPDIFFAFNGHVFFFEVKRKNGIIRKRQEVTIRQLNENKVPSYFVSSDVEVHNILMEKLFDIKKPLW